MSINIGPKAIHLVIDSAGFIERAKLDTYGVTCHTVPSVLEEIRDKQTKEFINALPYPISIDIPSSESIKWVHNLAKKTGDYLALSKTDIEVIALTYELFTRITGKEPSIKEVKRIEFTSKLFPHKPSPCHTSVAHANNDDDFEYQENSDLKEESEETSLELNNALHNEGVGIAENDSDDAEDSEEQIEEDEWITSDNFDKKLENGLGFGISRRDEELDDDAGLELAPVPVACLTKDFAMQNVMMHAGFSLLALSGKIIKRARTHVLWCGSCYAYTTKQGSYFCAVCGHPNMRRIPVTLHEDGQLEFHFARRFNKSLRGTKFPVPRPKGGKHADNAIYRADQRLPDWRAPKAKNAMVQAMGATNGRLGDCFDEVDDDYLLGGGADAVLFPTHDVNSKAACQGLRKDGQIAPTVWEQGASCEHGLKPTRFRANVPGRRRTGGRNNKLTK